MARTTNKVTSIRQRMKTLLEGVNGSPTYFNTVDVPGDVKYGIPVDLNPKTTVQFFIERGDPVRDVTTQTVGTQYEVESSIDFTIVGVRLPTDSTADATYTMCEEIEQDILSALRSDPGFSCDGVASVDAASSYQVSEVKAARGLSTAARTNVTVTVSYISRSQV